MRNLLYIFIFITLQSCGQEPEPNVDYNKYKETLLKANKSSVAVENQQIEDFVKRKNWDMIKTGTGLRYFIYKSGKSETLAKNGQMAKVSYEVSLLNGTVCYSTKEKGPEQFNIGMDHVESGLHEGITYMHVGDKAKIIIPSHLAHGLSGDQDKIPSKSTIIYDIELLELK